jgi:hypothetical protein
MNPKANSKSRKELIEQLHDSTLAADLHERIYWVLKNKDDREKYVDTMNSYLGFFASSIQAHFIAVVVILYAIYEDRRDTVNVGRLCEGASAELKALVEPAYKRAKVIWKKIAILRNNHVGHVSDRLDIDAVFKLADLTYNEIKELIALTKKLVNLFSYAEDRSSYVDSVDSANDTYRMLERLRST